MTSTPRISLLVGNIAAKSLPRWRAAVLLATLVALTALHLVSIFAQPHLALRADPGPDQFEIRLPADVSAEAVQVKYFLTGPFGGRGSTLRQDTRRHSLLLATRVDGSAAETVRAILYAPGCQILTVSDLSLADSARSADFVCRSLPSMRFSGKVDLPGDIRKQLYDLDITYMAYWAHQFFGIGDGFVTTIRLARVTPDEDGMFELQLPDFSQDAMTMSFQLDAGIEFIAREQRTGNILTLLEPANVKPKVWSLPVKQSYPTPVVLRPQTSRHPMNERPRNPSVYTLRLSGVCRRYAGQRTGE